MFLFLSLGHGPDMTVMVDWAIKTNYLYMYLLDMTLTWLTGSYKSIIYYLCFGHDPGITVMVDWVFKMSGGGSMIHDCQHKCDILDISE